MSGTVRLLVIDDDAAARRMMRRVLERRGYVVDEAPDGRSGLDAVLADPPVAVLLDLRMPGELSGFDVAHQLREQEAAKGVIVIVVSASAHMDAQQAIREIGCDAFVEKPVDFDELDRVLAQLVPLG